ncbi:MAG: hypothetical protein ACLP7Q_10250 [Isosphaeraceae bacterium]
MRASAVRLFFILLDDRGAAVRLKLISLLEPALDANYAAVLGVLHEWNATAAEP